MRPVFFYSKSGILRKNFLFTRKQTGLLSQKERKIIYKIIGSPPIPTDIYFLDGFFRREGSLHLSFSISKNRIAALTVKQNWNNFHLLMAYQKSFGCGKLYLDNRKKGKTFVFKVVNKYHLITKVLPVLDLFSFHGIKGLQYKVWKEALLVDSSYVKSKGCIIHGVGLQSSMFRAKVRKNSSLEESWKKLKTITRTDPLFPNVKMKRSFVSGFFRGDGHLSVMQGGKIEFVFNQERNQMGILYRIENFFKATFGLQKKFGTVFFNTETNSAIYVIGSLLSFSAGACFLFLLTIPCKKQNDFILLKSLTFSS